MNPWSNNAFVGLFEFAVQYFIIVNSAIIYIIYGILFGLYIHICNFFHEIISLFVEELLFLGNKEYKKNTDYICMLRDFQELLLS